MKVTNNFVLFWGDYLGNWSAPPSPIRFGCWDTRFTQKTMNGFDVHSFKTSEHLFMYLKAAFFGDWAIAKEIEEAPTPKKAKELGRLVKGFSEEEWNKVRYEVMFSAVYNRSTSDEKFKSMILKDEWRFLEFVEASPYDRIWGIGLLETDPDANMKKKWRGLNLLGKALTELREYLLWEQWITSWGLNEFREDLIWCPSQIYYWFMVGEEMKLVYMRWRYQDPWNIVLCKVPDPSNPDSWNFTDSENITDKVGIFKDSEYEKMEEKVLEYLRGRFPDTTFKNEIIRKNQQGWKGTNIIH